MGLGYTRIFLSFFFFFFFCYVYVVDVRMKMFTTIYDHFYLISNVSINLKLSYCACFNRGTWYVCKYILMQTYAFSLRYDFLFSDQSTTVCITTVVPQTVVRVCVMRMRYTKLKSKMDCYNEVSGGSTVL